MGPFARMTVKMRSPGGSSGFSATIGRATSTTSSYDGVAPYRCQRRRSDSGSDSGCAMVHSPTTCGGCSCAMKLVHTVQPML